MTSSQRCPTCKGAKQILLLYSFVECSDCGGTGKLSPRISAPLLQLLLKDTSTGHSGPLTEEEVRTRCGLQPFPFHQARTFGRTTAMLVQVVSAYSKSRLPMYIVAHSRLFAQDLCRKAQRMAQQCGLNPEPSAFRPESASKSDLLRGIDPNQIVYDHY